MTPTFQPRIVEITVGTAGAPGRTWGTYTPGQLPIRCAAKVDCTASSKPDQCTARIWNLSEASLRFLEMKDQVLIVRAGEGVASQIFAGDIPTGGVSSQKSGPDRVTEIKGKVAGRKWAEATVSVSYPPGTSSAVPLQDAVRAMGATIGYMGAVPPVVMPGGFAFMGKARDLLDKAILTTPLAWWFQQGALIYIMGPGELVPGNVPLLTPTSGLRGSPKRTDKGIEFECRFNPAVRPGGGASLQSMAVTGLYRVNALTHEVDNWGPAWITKAKTERAAL
jgi:hypothetical protein